MELSNEQLEFLAREMALRLNPPFYTLDQLAELGGPEGPSKLVWRQIMNNYPNFFTKVGATPVIRASRLEALLEAAEGDKLFTTEMSQAAKARLKGNRNGHNQTTRRSHAH